MSEKPQPPSTESFHLSLSDAFTNISATIEQSMSPTEILGVALSETTKFFNATMGLVNLFEGTTGELVCLHQASKTGEILVASPLCGEGRYKIDEIWQECPARTEQPLLLYIDEIVEEVNCPLLEGNSKAACLMCSPLKSKACLLGTLCLSSDETGKFTLNDLEIFIALTNQANIAIENIQLRKLASSFNQTAEEKTIKHDRTAAINAALLELETTLGRAHGVQAVCEVAVELVSQLFTGAQGYILLWDSDRNRMNPAAAPPNLSDSLREKFFSLDAPYDQHECVAKVLNTCQPLMVEDVENNQHVSEAIAHELGIHSFILMPLLDSGKLLGVIYICRGEVGEFSDRDVELAKSAARRIAKALVGERANEKVQQQLVQISLLNQITRAIAERQDLESIFRVMLNRLENHRMIDFGGVCIYDDAADTLT